MDFIYCKGSTHAHTPMIQISSTVLQKKGRKLGNLHTISFTQVTLRKKKKKRFVEHCLATYQQVLNVSEGAKCIAQHKMKPF